MSSTQPRGLSPFDSSAVSETVTSFVESTDAPESAAEPFVELVEGLAHQLTQAEQDRAQARERAREAEERVEELEEQIDDEREERTLDIANDRKRLTDLEDRVADIEEGGSPDTTPPEADKDGSTTPATPLERVCALDEETADRELTANQSRARFIARDLTDYADKVPAGFSLRSGDIATVLRAGTDCRGRTQTVARVMDFLSDLGGDGVEIVERRGTRRVVFTEEATRRLEQLSSQPTATDNTVVMGAGT